MDKVRPPENREQHSWKVKHKICELMAKINVFLDQSRIKTEQLKNKKRTVSDELCSLFRRHRY